MHEDGGDLNEQEEHGQECTCVVPPVPVFSHVEAKTCYGDGKRRAYGRGNYGGVQPQIGRGWRALYLLLSCTSAGTMIQGTERRQRTEGRDRGYKDLRMGVGVLVMMLRHRREEALKMETDTEMER